MATTTTVVAINQLKGPHPGGDLHAYEVVAHVTGTYATATKPSFDFLAAIQAMHEGVSAVSVKGALAFQDYDDGTNVYTASNAVTAIGSSKTVTWTVESGATDGGTGSEVADGTSLAGYFSFLVVATVTGA